MYQLGLPLSTFLMLLVLWATHWSSNIYLYARELVPENPISTYEIGYILAGRAFIFVLAIILCINSFGICIIYFMVFGETAGQLACSFAGDIPYDSTWYTGKWSYIVGLAAILLPVVLQKQLNELTWLSYTLFISLSLFILMNFILLTFDGNFAPEGLDVSVLEPNLNWGAVSALSVVMVAYSYQANVFPIYSELRKKTNEEY